MSRVIGRRGVVAAIAGTMGVLALAIASAGFAGGTGERMAKAKGVHLHTLAHFNQPTFASGPPHSKHLVFVTERQGKIKTLHSDRKGGTFLDMRHWVCVQCGNVLAASMNSVQMTKKVRVRCAVCSTVNVAVEEES